MTYSNFSISSEDLISDLFSRRYSNYYSWMIEEVDKKGGLMTLGSMVILGGQHGAGKSTYITELSKHNSLDKKVMLIPLEMGATFTMMMLACNLFNNVRDFGMLPLGYGDVEEGYLYLRPQLDQDLFKKCINDIYENYPNLHIQTPPTLDFIDLKQMIIEAYSEHDIKFFVIDHLHQLTSYQEKDGETAFYSRVAKELSKLAKDLNVSLLCVVQLTKAANGVGHSVDLSAFKGTSEFTSNAHRAVIIKKPDYKPIKVGKSRDALKEFANDWNMDPVTTTPEDIEKKHKESFKLSTKNIRELNFLKTRGRTEGTVTIRMEKGKFEFLNDDEYVYKQNF